jgi:hypothetical protein
LSISTLESATSRRMLDEMHDEQDRRTAAVDTLREAFLLQAKSCRDTEPGLVRSSRDGMGRRQA